MALNLPNIAPANPWSDTVDVKNYLTDKALNQEKARIENKFKPLEMGIKAQNALSYSNRMGNIGLFLRGISQLPVAERQAYLADPANRKNYNTMLEQFRQGINNPQASGNILTPEFMQQFGFGGQQEPSNPIVKMINYFTGQGNPNAMMQSPQAQMPPQMPQAPQAPQMPQVPVTPNAPIQNAPQMPQAQQEQEIAQESTPEQDIPVTSELTPEQRSIYTAQLRTNNQAVGPQLKNRADQAIAFDKFLQLHREQIGKVFKDAFKYSQLYGRGKKWMEKFRTEQPEEYKNYITAKNSLVPLMSNGIRFLEAMGVSHEAQADARNQVSSAIDALDVSPDTALQVFNNHMAALEDVTQGILDSAEPNYPGVRRKLAGVPPIKGDFIKQSKKSPGKAPSGRMLVKDPDGKLGSIPESQWEDAKKAGYKKV